MSKHTPGPWTVAFGGMDGDDFAVIGSKHSERAICNLEPRDYTQANARLIASAPELLEALRLVIDDTCNLKPLEFKMRLDIARAAIAKATAE